VIAVIVIVVLVTGSSPPASKANSAPTGSVAVKRRNLVSTDIESGTIGYANPQTVYDRLSGTITWLPPVGRRIGRGGTLFQVDGQPVPLMYGTTPAYRSLGPDDTDGPDIEELNANLVALGFNPGGILVDDVWQTATTDGVEQLQAALGETETGTLTLGQVVFLPGPQLVSAVDASVGATSGGGGAAGGGSGGSGSSGASTPLTASHPEFVGLVVGLATADHTPRTAPTHVHAHAPKRKPKPSTKQDPGRRHPAPSSSDRELAALTALLKAESAQLRAEAAQLRAAKASAKNSGGGGGSSSGSHGGGSAGSAGASAGGSSPTPVLDTTSTRLAVTVDLPASSQSEAVVGDKVSVELPAGNSVSGTITAVSRVAQSSNGGSGGGGSGGGGSGSGSGSSSTVPVTIALQGRHNGGGLDQAAVSVSFTQQRANHVLSVPVTALVAVPGGSYDLQVASAPHRLIPVQTGLFAAGDVQVTGPGLYPGLEVTASQG
jgi:hypothetical protein